MIWLELSFKTTHDLYDLVSNIFIEAGSKGVLLEDSNTVNETHEDHFGEIYRLNEADYPSEGIVVKGYIALTEETEVLLEQIRTRLLNLDEVNEQATFEVKTLDEEDWANSWKRHYEPIKISERLVIKPSWLDRSTDSSVVEILLDPGMAFGSGTHETTRLCLELLEQYVTPSDFVVDVGTGSGILAIAASKLQASGVYAVDLDAMAVIRARENVMLNACSNIQVEKNNLIDGVLALAEKPTLMVANILAPIIVDMLPDVVHVLPKGKRFICSGIVEHEQEMVVSALLKHGFEVEDIKSLNGWVAIVATI